MNVMYANPESFIGRLAKNIHDNAGKHPVAVDFTAEEYAQLKEEAGAPPTACIPAVLGIPVLVDGKPAQEQSAGIITV